MHNLASWYKKGRKISRNAKKRSKVFIGYYKTSGILSGVFKSWDWIILAGRTSFWVNLHHLFSRFASTNIKMYKMRLTTQTSDVLPMEERRIQFLLIDFDVYHHQVIFDVFIWRTEEGYVCTHRIVGETGPRHELFSNNFVCTPIVL